jgi:hypothetical protein
MRQFLLALALASITATNTIADSQESDFQGKMLVPIQMTKAAAEAVQCGLRSNGWGLQIAEMDVTASIVIAKSEWPKDNDKANQETKAMSQEFINADDAGRNPSPDVCNELASSGYLDKMDQTLSVFQTMMNNNPP